MYWIALVSVALLAQDRATTELSREIERLEQLAAAGAIAPVRVVEARNALADAQDMDVLNRTLYGKIELEEYTESQAASMISAAERRVARQQERLARLQKLIDNGVSPRTELEPVQAELDARIAAVASAKARIRLFEELVEMANAEHEAVTLSPSSVLGPSPMVEHFQGLGKFSDADLKKVVLEFEKEFAKPLPVSARGETAVHRALGFDHRGRVDVGVNPDSSEGQWMRKFLAANRIPYIAFRRAIAGQATAPHIHIGPPSPRLTSAD
jgi:hypothetical protein